MKYILKTETNENGNLVFSKKRQGKDYIYLAKDENGNIKPVLKSWIIEHQTEIVNVRVSGDSIYAVERKKKIDDFGEKIGGAKKDLMGKKRISLDALKGMSFKEKDSYVKKDKIWPKVSIEDLVNQGHTKPAAWFICQMRAALPAKPSYISTDMDECMKVQETYIKFIEGVRRLCDNLKDHENTAQCNKAIMSFMMSNGILSKSIYGRLELSLGCGYLYTKKFAKLLNMDVEDVILETCCHMTDFLTVQEKMYYGSRILSLEGCTYKIEGEALKFTKQFQNAYTTYYSYLYGKKDQIKEIPDYVDDFQNYYKGNKSAYALVYQGDGSRKIMGLFDSYEAAENARKKMAQSVAKADKKAAEEKKAEEMQSRSQTTESQKQSEQKVQRKKNLNPSLATITRKGRTVRSRNIEGKDFINTFGIRGGEFGNWVNEAERQENMNFAYESFYDLALVLGIPVGAIGLNHRLSIAFGARGQGIAAAHYESGREVINLTRMKGAGNLAHEYFHAIDDMLGKSLGKTQFATEMSRDTPKAIETLVNAMTYKTVLYSADELKQTKLQEAQANIDKLMKDMEDMLPDSSLSEDLRKEKYCLIEGLLEKARIYGFKFREEDFKKMKYNLNPVMNGLFNFIDKNSKRYRMTYNNQAYLAQKFFMIGKSYDDFEEVSGTTEKKEFTTFYKNAKKLSSENSRMGHNYWDSNIELAARAFACYVKDKLAEQGYINDYLCGHADIKNECGTPVYPVGEERQAINKAFDALFAELRKSFFKC